MTTIGSRSTPVTAGGSACSRPPTTCRRTGRTRTVRSRPTSTSGYRTSTRRRNAPSSSGPACCAAANGGTRCPTRPSHPFDLCRNPDDPRTTLMDVMIDCPDAKALSHFYAELLGKPVTYEADGVAMIGEDGAQPVMFQQVEHYTAPRWPNPAMPAADPPRRDGPGRGRGATRPPSASAPPGWTAMARTGRVLRRSGKQKAILSGMDGLELDRCLDGEAASAADFRIWPLRYAGSNHPR